MNLDEERKERMLHDYREMKGATESGVWVIPSITNAYSRLSRYYKDDRGNFLDDRCEQEYNFIKDALIDIKEQEKVRLQSPIQDLYLKDRSQRHQAYCLWQV